MKSMLFSYLFFSFIFHLYAFFFKWESPDQPTAPTLVLISRDLLFIILACIFIGIFLVRNALDLNDKKTLAINSSIFVFLKIFSPFLIFSAISLICTLHTNTINILQHNIRNLLLYSFVIPMVLYVGHTSKKNVLPTLANIFIASSTLLSIIGVIIFFSDNKKLLWGGDRLFSLMGNPNTFGTFLIFPILLIIAILLLENNYKNMKKTMFLFMLMINIYALMLTMSFQSIAGCLLGIFLMIIFIKKGKSLHYLLVMFLGAAAIIVFSLGTAKGIMHRLDQMLFSANSTSLTGRIAQLKQVISFFSSDNYLYFMLGDYLSTEYHKYDSQYWNILVNNGVFSFLFFFYPIIRVLIEAFKHNNSIIRKLNPVSYGIFSASLITVIIVLGVINNFTAIMQRYPINLYFYFMLAVLIMSYNKIIYVKFKMEK